MAVPDVTGTDVAAPISCTLRVRYGECDPQGVVFNAHYLAYLDIGVTELFRTAFGSYQAMAERGVDFVVAEAGLRYHSPAHFDEELDLGVAIERLGTTSLITSYRIQREEQLLVEGTLRHVLIDLGRLAARDPDPKAPIPRWMREQLAPFWMFEE